MTVIRLQPRYNIERRSNTENPTEAAATMIILQLKVQMVMEFINLHQILQ